MEEFLLSLDKSVDLPHTRIHMLHLGSTPSSLEIVFIGKLVYTISKHVHFNNVLLFAF